MSILYIPIGIPGCGKSHMASALGVDTVVSTDTIRYLLTGNENDQSQNGEVFKRYYQQIESSLIKYRTVYADATNLTGRGNLSEIVERVRGYRPVTTHVLLFCNPIQALTRNRKRERRVPEDVMQNMIEKYESMLTVLPDEMYDYVTEIASVR